MSENNKDLNAVDCHRLCPRNDKEQGRSMVEMLGTLAIVGVLSVGAIGGYSYAMNKHRTNELIYEATKRAQWVGTQLELNNSAPSLNTFGNDSFGGGSFTGEVKTDLANPNQFGIAVSELKEGVCKNIIKGLGTETNGVIRAVLTTDGTSDFNRSNCADDAAFLLVFNRDLSANDTPISASDPEVSGEATEPSSIVSEATATEASDRKLYCNDRGDWDGNTCDCDAGFEGESCNIEINAQPDEPETTAIGTANKSEEPTIDCGAHGEQSGHSCVCDSGWQGDDCSEQKPVDQNCSGHGYWDDYEQKCVCNTGYYDSDCSEQEGEVCDENRDCDDGYFCKYSRFDYKTGPTAQGKCEKVSVYRGGTRNSLTWSDKKMDWWSAENFCDAVGKHMPTIDSFQCHKDGTITVISVGAADGGFCCKDASTQCSSYWSDSTQRVEYFSSKIVTVKNTIGTTRYYWTQSLTNDSGYVFSVNLNDGKILYSGRYDGTFALCE